MAKIQSLIVVPIMHQMIHTGKLPKFMQKKIKKMDESKKELVHVFYATKMGEKYEKRYRTYFKNPDIIRYDMQHEELFCCHSEEWVEEVRKAVEVFVQDKVLCYHEKNNIVRKKADE